MDLIRPALTKENIYFKKKKSEISLFQIIVRMKAVLESDASTVYGISYNLDTVNSNNNTELTDVSLRLSRVFLVAGSIQAYNTFQKLQKSKGQYVICKNRQGIKSSMMT